MRAPSIASANTTTTTTKVIDNQELFTITQVNEKRIRFNERIGMKHAYFNLIFLIEEYTRRIAPALALDFKFLTANLPKTSGVENENNLDFAGLEEAHLLQLCRLMTRSCGRINFYYMLGFDGLLLEYPKTYPTFLKTTYGSEVESSPFLPNNELNESFYLTNLNKLTMSEGLIFLERFKCRLTMPYKTVEVIPPGMFKFLFS
jgi:hypothetical protein